MLVTLGKLKNLKEYFDHTLSYQVQNDRVVEKINKIYIAYYAIVYYYGSYI